MSEKITVKQVAERLGKSEQFIRMGLQRGILPLGKGGANTNFNLKTLILNGPSKQ